MARQRSTHIQESLEFLLNLERHYRGESQEPRIKMLRSLKEDPTRTLEEAAALAGASGRSANRWWQQYQKSGVDGLLARRSSAASNGTIGRNELEELRAKLQSGELITLNDVQAWLRERFGLAYSLKGVANLLQRKLKARRMWIVSEDSGVRIGESRPQKATADAPIIPDKLLHFLNRLPLTGNVQAAIERYKEALQELIGEMDRVSIFVSVSCDLSENTSRDDSGMLITIDTALDAQGVSVSPYPEGERPSDRYLENFRAQGLPLDDFHPPFIVDYYYNDSRYLGTIFLWRDRTKTPISDRARRTVALMEPFIIYMLSDLVARYNYAHPVDRMFHDALRTMTEESHLSPQERRVVTLRLLGLAYKEIAGQLHISEDAIKKHLGSVHRKTGTRSYTELFAKYFTPRLNLHET